MAKAASKNSEIKKTKASKLEIAFNRFNFPANVRWEPLLNGTMIWATDNSGNAIAFAYIPNA